VDIDAFFPSVERLLIPSLRDRPVVVGSGCIASCSYEARRSGLHAGMPLHQARRLCPAAVILPGNYQIYRCFAEHVWQICRRFTCGLETYLDEAYGEAVIEGFHGGPPHLGRQLQRQVSREVGLTVSVGLAANRMMAKIASSSAKPVVRRGSPQAASQASPRSGVAWIPPGQEESFLAPLGVEKLLGVGPKTAQKLGDMNVRTVGELAALDRRTLQAIFGRRGELLYERCRGRDHQKLRPTMTPKTISRETTFHKPTSDRGKIGGMLFYLLERAMRAMRGAKLLTGRVELSIRYDDWKGLTAGRSLPGPTDLDNEVYPTVLQLLEQLYRRRVSLRHVGVVLSRFCPAGGTVTLFTPQEQIRRRGLQKTVDTIRDRFGHGSLVTGESIGLLGKLEQNDYGFVLRTPCLTK